MKNPNIRKYLATAATVLRVEKRLAAWGKSLQSYFDALRAKQEKKEDLSYYFSPRSIRRNPYPKSFVELVRSWSFSNLHRFNFLKSLKGRQGSYHTRTSLIHLPKSGGNLETLVHEVTHALRPTSHAQPQGASYLGFMRDSLCEEIVAESSIYYGCGGSKQILNKFSSAPIFLNRYMISKGIKQNNRKTLIESAVYALLSKYCFETGEWIRHYTKYYNQENNTNHAVSQTFEPPLLPPTLARAVKDILENNPSIAEIWQEKTGITPETLALAAEQIQWPMFKSDILNQQNLNQQNIGVLEESRHAGR